MEEFTTNYLVKNGFRVLIIGQLSINESVQFLGIPNFVRGSGLSLIENLQAPTDPTGCVHANTSNQKWVVIPGGPYIMWSVAWGSTIPARLDSMPRSPVNLCAAARRVRDDFLHRRRRECMRIPTTSCNYIVNPRIHCRGDDWEGPVTQ